MVLASVGTRPELKVVRQASEEETLEPGYYVVSQRIVGPVDRLTSRTWCKEKISELAWKTLEKLRDEDPTAVTWWKFHYGEVIYRGDVDRDKIEADVIVIFEVTENKYAAFTVITIAKIIAVLAALIISLFLAIKVIKTVVYVAEPLVEGGRKTAEVLGELMPVIVPLVLGGLVLGLALGRE